MVSPPFYNFYILGSCFLWRADSWKIKQLGEFFQRRKSSFVVLCCFLAGHWVSFWVKSSSSLDTIKESNLAIKTIFWRQAPDEQASKYYALQYFFSHHSQLYKGFYLLLCLAKLRSWHWILRATFVTFDPAVLRIRAMLNCIRLLSQVWSYSNVDVVACSLPMFWLFLSNAHNSTLVLYLLPSAS